MPKKHIPEGQLFNITPVGGDQQPFVATITPVTEPAPPPDPTVKWEYVEGEGWYLAYGPSPKPRPLPPDIPAGAEGRWVYTDQGWWFTMGPYDKPKPPGSGGGETPPPAEPEIHWQYYPEQGGWFIEYGPTPKPRPVPPELQGYQGKWVQKEDGWYWQAGPYDKPQPPLVPPTEPPTPDDPKAKWVYDDAGWYLVWGPFPKPRPIP